MQIDLIVYFINVSQYLCPVVKDNLVMVKVKFQGLNSATELQICKLSICFLNITMCFKS